MSPRSPRQAAARTMAALALMAIGQTAAANTEYRGGGFVSGFSAECAADGWSGISQVTARFRPAGEPNNHATQNLLTMFLGNFALGHRYPALTQGQWVTVSDVGSVGGSFGTGADVLPRFRLLATPTGTVLNPTERHLVFEINNFAYVTGCQARVNLFMHRR